MKKTVLTLSLLFGSMCAMAQVEHSAATMKQMDRDALSVMKHTELKAERASLQFKSGTPALTCTFGDATEYTLGVTAQHVPTLAKLRMAFTADSTDAWWRTNYPTFGRWWGMAPRAPRPARGFELIRKYSESPNVEDGFVFASLIDAIDAGQAHWGPWDTYVKLNNPINTTGWNIVDIRINQLYQKFNNDQCYIDWCTDGNFTPGNYDSVKVNTKNEIPTNVSKDGDVLFTLPIKGFNASLNTTEQTSLYIRFRITCPATESTNMPGGYYWFIDNVRVEDGPTARVKTTGQGYNEGAYTMLPHNLVPAPIMWSSFVSNTGGQNLTNLHVESQYFTATAPAAQGGEWTYATLGSPLVGGTKGFVPNGILSTDSIGSPIILKLGDSLRMSSDGKDVIHTALATASQPTQNLGVFAVTSNIRANAGATEVNVPSDTILYYVRDSVTLNGNHKLYRWGRDRGVLFNNKDNRAKFRMSHMTYGNKTIITEDGHYNKEQYRVCLEYTANDSSDWYIRGVEIVAAADSCVADVIIKGSLWQENPNATTAAEFFIPVMKNDVPVLSEEYTVTAADLNSVPVDPDPTVWGRTTDFNTIFLPFKDTVKLEKGLPYYACYQMESDGNFAVGLDPYQRGLGMGGTVLTGYNALVFTPNTGSDQHSYGRPFGWYMDNTVPMIRMIISREPGDYSNPDTNTTALPAMTKPFGYVSAYPNPTNASATISYTLKVSGEVSLRIMDVVGKEVMNLPQGKQAAHSEHQVLVNTNNMANGVYFYTLSVNGVQQTGKLVVNR